MTEMSKFWREHLAEARDTDNMGEHVGLLHGLLMEGDDRIAELEAEVAALREAAEKLVTSEVFSADKRAMIALLEQEGET